MAIRERRYDVFTRWYVQWRNWDILPSVSVSYREPSIAPDEAGVFVSWGPFAVEVGWVVPRADAGVPSDAE